MTVQNQSILIGGIYTPIPTYFLNDGKYSLDTETQVKHAVMLYNAGINGLVLSGSMGEASNLTLEERLQSIRAIRNAIPDTNFKLIAGMPPQSSSDVVAESVASSQAGADFVIVLVQGYFGPSLISQQGIIDYFSTVADNSALPLIIYNYPSASNGVDIEVETFVALSESPNIVGVKLTHFNLATYTLLGKNKKLEENNFKLFTGLGQILIPALSVGIVGAIDGLSGIFPKTMIELFRLYNEGSFKEAAELQYKVTAANQMIFELNVVGVKHALYHTYGFGELLSGRPPLSRPANLSIYEKYKADIKALQKFERSL